MYCPACTEERLLITERSGIEIDYCGKCRGVWLDRGELDKLIERANEPTAVVPRDRDRDDDDDDRRDREPRRDDYRRDGSYKPKKKKSFLSDFFEMGD